MTSFKENITVEHERAAYNVAKKRTIKGKIIWAVVFGALLLAFLIMAMVLDVIGQIYIYITLPILFLLVIYIDFFHDVVKFKLRIKKLRTLLDASGNVFLEMDFNSEHLAVNDPLRRKKDIIRIDYDRLSSVFYANEDKMLFFLVKGDSGDYFSLFLEGHDKQEIKEACETFPNEIINQSELETYLEVKLERSFVEVIESTNNDDKTNEIKDSEGETKDIK